MAQLPDKISRSCSERVSSDSHPIRTGRPASSISPAKAQRCYILLASLSILAVFGAALLICKAPTLGSSQLALTIGCILAVLSTLLFFLAIANLNLPDPKLKAAQKSVII